MTLSFSKRKLWQVRAALGSAIHEIQQSGNVQQDIACKQRHILEAIDSDLARSCQTPNPVDTFATRLLFADPNGASPDEKEMSTEAAKFFIRRPDWRMVSGLAHVPAEQIFLELRAAGIVPPLAFEAFLGYFQTEAADSGMEALTA